MTGLRSEKKFGLNWVQDGSEIFGPCLNLELNFQFSPEILPNFGPNFGPVLKSSGSNFGSELNYSNPTAWLNAFSMNLFIYF